MIFKVIGKLTYKAAEYLVRGVVFKSKFGAQFLTEGESKKFLSSKNKGLLIDGDKKHLSESESFQNVCFTARVGAGKTTKYIIPNVMAKAEQNVSMVVHDPKGEVHEATSGYLHDNGYRIVVFNPHNVKESNLFNPFTEAKSTVELEIIAETLIWSGNPKEGEAYWNNGATRILSALIKCLSFGDKKYFNLPNLYHLLQNFGSIGEGLEEWIGNNCWDPEFPEDDSVLNEWKGALTGNKEAIQSFVGICLTALRGLTNRDLRTFFSKSDYDLLNLRKQKTIIYLVTPPENQKYYSFVTSLFFRSVFNECMRNNHLSGQSLPVYILYDEFGNSYITDFVSVANTIRGYGVSLSIILQSISQLSMRYGQKTAEAIQGAFNTNICLSSSDPITAEYFSKMTGRVRERHIPIEPDKQDSYREYNLLNSNEVRTMQDHEALLISRNRQPVKLVVTPYFSNRKFKKAAQFPQIVNAESNRVINPKLVRL
ncbi:type IV secretory system conjugative DNA transfer family protein [Pseudoalteromonas sp. C2R02]|uniref:type IV secretory system conjugative DNA transfer family protein n=1 Tax=Pseudoalteromonas sp. C2R02 TaxID=2841565 RepID=UPI001C083ACF|nr:type IV secretory system conjugative DNA transfer family protein [Pseudoalteromonas sp. C2R02]MBU2969832.1 type IV secretory system conjugative DNA transfer family protein [Pseudoalteromonas sp. C2R02]